MAEYIDRDALIDNLQKFATDDYSAIVNNIIMSMPKMDVAPVVHGQWESVDSSYWRWTPSGAVSVSHMTYRCGRCGRGTVVKTSYCPNCGAKMYEYNEPEN